MKKVLSLLLVLALVVSMAACGGKTDPTTTTPSASQGDSTTAPTSKSDDTTKAPDDEPTDAPDDVVYVRADDDDVYDEVLGEYESYLEAAKAAETNDERFVLYAYAEALLLDAAVFIPTTTQGGAYTISRIAPHTIPYVMWGNDDDRVKSLVISDEFVTKEEREELLTAWKAAVAGEGTYDPAAYLTSKGHSLLDTYKTTFSTAPVTIDWLNTSSQADTEITVNCVDGLVEYNNLGVMQPALAESWEVSEDGLEYTFNLRKGVKWYTAEGTEYAELTANDFVAGIHHMLDAQAGLEWLLEGVVKGVSEYLDGESFDGVGYEAVDDYTLKITLEAPTSYFMTMLTYSCFLPICDSFFQSKGGVYGLEEFAEASATDAYTFGNASDVSTQVYCGSHLLKKLTDKSEIVCEANPNYYRANEVTIKTIQWIYDEGDKPTQLYADTVSGVYPGIGLSESAGTLKLAKEDGNFDKYSYISDTNSTTYFGGLNLNRGTFVLENGNMASPKTEQQKIDTNTAYQNKNFRKAIVHAFDKGTYNAVSRGEDLKYTNLRNMYTAPQFVQLSEEVVDEDGTTFAAGTFYGDIVQHYLDEIGAKVDVADQQDGWFKPEAAKEYLAAAKEELGDSVTWPIYIDIEFLGTSETNKAQLAAVKEKMEETLGSENVVINMIEATTTDDYYASGYRASNGEAGNFDLFYGSGWGPDYGDPSTYLDTFLGGGAGYMTKVIGLY